MRNKKIITVFTISIVLILVSIFLLDTTIDKNKSLTNKEKLTVFTTTNILRDAVKNIAQDKVDIVCLMDQADPHRYQPTNSDLEKLTNFDILFYGGLNLEAKLDKVLDSLVKSKKKVVNTSDYIPVEHLIPLNAEDKRLKEEGEEKTIYDPHVWFDITIWRHICEGIKKELSEIDPKNSELYNNNYQSYMGKLDELATFTKERFGTINKEKRHLLTSHDAFNYFGRFNDVDVKGIQGVNTDAEAGAFDVTQSVEFIVNNDVKAIFMEKTVSPKMMQAVQEAVKAKGKEVSLGGDLFSDSLGDESTPEGTYIGMYKYNVNTIVESIK